MRICNTLYGKNGNVRINHSFVMSLRAGIKKQDKILANLRKKLKERDPGLDVADSRATSTS